MRQAGRYLPEYRAIREKYDFLTVCKTPELASEITIQPIDIIETDAAILFSDILVIPEAMGMHLEVIESKGPVFDTPIRSAEQIEHLQIEGVVERLNYVMEAVKMTVEKLDGRVPLIGFSGSPWTLLTYMVEGKGSKNFDVVKSFIYNEPASRAPTFADFSRDGCRIFECENSRGLRCRADFRHLGEHFIAVGF